ncbi:hypothetical protein [Rubrobacter marinus]|nr:hypothetical protein [Rubrobacter marinus]
MNEPRTGRQQGDGAGAASGVVVLGLLAPPQVPREVVEDLAAELPGALSEHVSDRVSWKVPTMRDPRVPDAEGGEHAGDETIEDVGEWRRKEGWDLAVCVTDLPLLHDDGRAVVAEASPQQDVALVSLPALGVVRRRRHARDAIVRFVDEVLGERLGVGQEHEEDHGEGGRRSSKPTTASGLVVRSEEDGHLQLVMPAGLGQLRLLTGMVRATHPFRVVLGLSYALTAALGTAAFTITTSTIWQLSGAFSWARLSVLVVASVVTMIAYITVRHGMWYRSGGRTNRELTALLNATTLITLTIGVLSFFAALFALTLAVAGFLIDAGVLGTTIGRPAGLGEFVALALMTSSLATLGGTLGSGLQTSDDVHEAAYTYHGERRSNEGQSQDGSG